jgi:MIP family channel proteins
MMRGVTATTRALLAEVVGTFFFFTIGAGAILADASGGGSGLVGIALAHGLALAVAVSIFGPTSGAHFNPAVSLALALGGAFRWDRLIPYWIAQLGGGVLAGVVLLAAFPEKARALTHLGTPSVAPGVSDPAAVLVEGVLTSFLALAVFGTAVSPTAPRIAGFGIGLTVLVDILAGGPITGAAMNPARFFGTAIPALFFDHWWVYVVGPLAGGAAGGLLWRYAFAPTVAAVSTQR